MLSSIKKLFGIGPQTDFFQLTKQGALILDVRNKTEYDDGHIEGSINIPVNKLSSNLNLLTDKTRPIITCCVSGARSESAKNILLVNGYKKVYNGGGWNKLKSKIN